ncbi:MULTISPECIES: SH3 domain-containing protein [unclassified Streptomyces]|uniref:SH3 domain-containing protein n=1 Tax=unclassified Streptomyces TaxID=2593676 RepID=UPI000691B3E3|nr:MULTISPECIES: SH3 domain-containing protein [unclassified Streptomyces]MCI3930180.1 SH3 domain-containing protein [Streptomyces sp. AN091965]
MARKIRGMALAAAVAVGVGMVGVSAASAMPDVPSTQHGPSAAVRTPVPVPGPAGTAAAAAAAGADGLQRGEIARATVNGLRLRTGPGTQYRILGMLAKGDRVKLVGAKQDARGQIWHRVTLRGGSAYGLPSGYRGWVTAAYLY